MEGGKEVTNEQFIKVLRKTERIFIVILLLGIVLLLLWNFVEFIRTYDEVSYPHAAHPLAFGFALGLFTFFLVSWYKNVGKGDIEQ